MNMGIFTTAQEPYSQSTCLLGSQAARMHLINDTLADVARECMETAAFKFRSCTFVLAKESCEVQ